MPKAHAEEFRRDVVAVVRKRAALVAQIAKDFGTSPVLPVELAPQGRHRRCVKPGCHSLGVDEAAGRPANGSDCWSRKRR